MEMKQKPKIVIDTQRETWCQRETETPIFSLTIKTIRAIHTKIDLSSLWESVHTHLDRSWVDLSSLWESVHTNLDRSWVDLSSHLSVHIQIALDLDRSAIDLTH